VISVCEVRGGTAYNIIPDTVSLTASVRTFGEKTRALVEKEVKRKAKETAKANGCTAKVKWEAGYPSVVNDEAMTETARKVIGVRFGEKHELKIDPIMPGEDFSYFTDDKPGFFAELGTRNIKKHTDMPHHNSCYRMDETALKFGVQYFTDMVYTLLDGTGKNMPADR